MNRKIGLILIIMLVGISVFVALQIKKVFPTISPVAVTVGTYDRSMSISSYCNEDHTACTKNPDYNSDMHYQYYFAEFEAIELICGDHKFAYDAVDRETDGEYMRMRCGEDMTDWIWMRPYVHANHFDTMVGYKYLCYEKVKHEVCGLVRMPEMFQSIMKQVYGDEYRQHIYGPTS